MSQVWSGPPVSNAADVTTPSRPTGGRAMDPARTPVGSGTISVVGIVLALLLTALGVVAVRDALVSGQVLDGTPWLAGAIAALDGLVPAGWAVPVGLVLLILGVWMLVVAVRPRPRTSIAVQSQTGVFVRPRDVQRLAVTAAQHVDGVLTAKATASRRKVTVTATTTGDDGTGDRVRAAVNDRLTPLAAPPMVEVKTVVEGGDR